MVSLPSKWARKFHLTKGDEIDVVEKGKELLITPELVPETRKATINISELETLWRRAVRALYCAGYDEIEIQFSKSGEIKNVYSILQEFVGFEIISQKENSCTIREIVETKETNFRTILSRTFNMLSSIAEDCSNALKEKNTELLRTISERDLIINKYSNFCIRIINKGLVEQENAPMLYYIILQIEALGDMYKELSKYLSEKNKIPSVSSIKIFDEITSLIGDFHSVLNRFDNKTVLLFEQKLRKTRKSIESVKTTSIQEVQIINYLSQMREILYGLVEPLLTQNL